MSAPRLTPAQRRTLSKAAAHKFGRVVGAAGITAARLLDAGLIMVSGYHYGPLYAITEAGRAAVRS